MLGNLADIAPRVQQYAQSRVPPQQPASGGGWWDSNPYTGPASGSAPVASPQAQIQTGGGQYPLASVSGEGFLAPWTTPFQAPSVDAMRNDPSYQFVMDEGRNQIQRGAAAKGNLLTGGTLKDLTAWSQGLASQQFDKIYNRALGEYQQAYNIFNNNQNTQFNRLSSIAGTGQTAAGQLQNASTNFGNAASSNITGAANAQAAAGMHNAGVWGNSIGTLANIGSDLAMRYPWNSGGSSSTNSGGYDGSGWAGGMTGGGYRTDQYPMMN